MEKHLVLVGRIVAVIAIIIALIVVRPLLGNSDQAFQYIQEFTGFFTPGITVIFLLGLFWKRATEAGAIAAAVASVIISFIFWFPAQYGGSSGAQRGPVHAPDGDRVRRLAPARRRLFTGLQGHAATRTGSPWTA